MVVADEGFRRHHDGNFLKFGSGGDRLKSANTGVLLLWDSSLLALRYTAAAEQHKQSVLRLSGR